MNARILLTAGFLWSLLALNAVNLPLDFEGDDYAITNFDGGSTTLVFNPNQSGMNTSSKVAKMVKNPGQVWGGSFIELDAAADLSLGKIFKMKFHSPRAGANVLLKLENKDDNGIFHEVEMANSLVNEWEELTFDFRTIDDSKDYHRVTLIIDNGTQGDGSENFTFYFDDIRQDTVFDAHMPNVPIDFESEEVAYTFMNFDGGAATVIDNPDSSAVNPSSRVARMVKSEGEVYGGSYLDLAGDLDFANNNTFTMKVHTPKAGTRVLLKVEFSADPGTSYEQEATSTTANEWEELVFDFSEIHPGNTYDRIVIILENGTMGDGSADFTFYFDDIQLLQIMDPPSLPLDFESRRIDYSFMDVGGNATSVTGNPDRTGINLSQNVVQLVKNDGLDSAFSVIKLAEPLDFSSDSLLKMKVHAPESGVNVLLRVENSADSTIFSESPGMTTVAHTWEELEFDFSDIDQGETYQKLILLFEPGTAGDGSVGFTFYLDEIRPGNASLTLPPEPAPVPPEYNPFRVLTVFSDVNSQKPDTDFFSGNADSTETQILAIEGDAVLEYTKFQQITMELEAEYDLNYMKFVHVDIYPTESFDIYVKPMSRFRRRYLEYVDTVAVVAEQWNSLEIPFGAFEGVDTGDPLDLRRFQAFRLERDSLSKPTIYVDNVYLFDDFVDTIAPLNLAADVHAKTDKTVVLGLTGEDNYGVFFFEVSYADTALVFSADSGVTINPVISGLEPGTEYTFEITAFDNDGNQAETVLQLVVTTLSGEPAPLTAAPVPTYPSEEVVSIYSDSYEQATSWALGAWNQKTLVNTESIEGNNAMKMTNFNYQGIELNSNIPAFDVTTGDYLHLDVWTPNAPGFEIRLISESASGKFQAALNVEFEPNVWNSIDIPLSDFSAATPELELDKIIQFRFTSPDHYDKLPLDDIIYLDNLIFTGVETVTRVEERPAGELQVYSAHGSLVVNTGKETKVEIFNITGSIVYSGTCDTHLSLDLSQGIYIVRAGDRTVKCMVPQ